MSKFKDMSVEELLKEKVAILKELFNLRVQRSIGQTPQTHLFRSLRRDIARIETSLTQREGSR